MRIFKVEVEFNNKAKRDKYKNTQKLMKSKEHANKSQLLNNIPKDKGY